MISSDPRRHRIEEQRPDMRESGIGVMCSEKQRQRHRAEWFMICEGIELRDKGVD